MDQSLFSGLEVEPDEEPVETLALMKATGFGPEPVAELMPPGFQLPALIKFIPNPQVRARADLAAQRLADVIVSGPAGLKQADEEMVNVRAAIKVIDAEFEKAAELSNTLHKRITSMRAEWKENCVETLDTKAKEIIVEQRRLNGLAEELRRANQAEADAKARLDAERAAADAKKSGATRETVAELRQQAKTATAPPVYVPPPPQLAGSTVAENWKARFIGTPDDDEVNPAIKDLSDAQRLQLIQLLKGIMNGVPICAIKELDWTYLNKRADAEQHAMVVPGLEAVDLGAVRAKRTGGRKK